MRNRLLLSMTVLSLTATTVGGQQGRPIDMTTAPAPVVAAVTRADVAIQELQVTLVTRLKEAMSEGGPAAAVSVCRDEAQELTAAVGAKHGLEIGRTTHALRNPANAPRPWSAPIVSEHAGRTAAEAEPAVLDLDGRVGVLRPIGTLDFCVTCHGPREVVEAAIGDVLASSYPADEAVGFAPGDLRGWMWAEVELE